VEEQCQKLSDLTGITTIDITKQQKKKKIREKKKEINLGSLYKNMQ